MSDADSHFHIKLLLRTQAITYLTNHSGIYIEVFILSKYFHLCHLLFASQHSLWRSERGVTSLSLCPHPNACRLSSAPQVLIITTSDKSIEYLTWCSLHRSIPWILLFRFSKHLQRQILLMIPFCSWDSSSIRRQTTYLIHRTS